MKSGTSAKRSAEKIIKSITSSSEFLPLKKTVENNICHKNESVFEHTASVVKRLGGLINPADLEEKSRHLVLSYFSKPIGHFKKADLFIISAFLHDIGKPLTIQKDKDGMTTCPNHELRSIEIAKKILAQTSLMPLEIEYIVDIIRVHSGYSLVFLDFLMSLGEKKLKETLNSVYYLPEIFLYMIADNEAAPIFSPYKLFILKNILVNKEIYSVKKSSQVAAERLGELVKIAALAIKKYSKPWPLEVRMLHLSEEVGELHDIYLQYLGLKDRKQEIEHLVGGMNDILLELIAIYDQLGVDISDVLEKEIRKK